ncbi:MAG TPA: PAS domain-containing protein [Patescibacteria group bacterium]|nr:PAS domain-containing protein [Patescibacteria group bacterium]
MSESNLEKLDKLFLAEKAAWWQMDLPSGKVIFSDNKAEMLEYPPEKFKKYQDFTDLLHPDDHDQAMKAMKDHLAGKNDFYETDYRIKNKDGDYIRFYDFGQILSQEQEESTIMGFVIQLDKNKDATKQISEFKNMFTQKSPSLLELVKQKKNS